MVEPGCAPWLFCFQSKLRNTRKEYKQDIDDKSAAGCRGYKFQYWVLDVQWSMDVCSASEWMRGHPPRKSECGWRGYVVIR